ncbi:MAG TPA: HAMP domain-containing sensor histidine kinase [Actinocrinis sp.]|nr:HAMP domain-containing sensor histidine kinase [Actinocrinis sp.]
MKAGRRSLRRRLALSLAGMFVLGYVVLTAAFYFFTGEYSTRTGRCLIGIYQCTGTSWIPGSGWPARLVAIGVVAALGASAWFGWYLIQEFLRPLRAAAEAVRRVGPQNLGQRVAMTGAGDELKVLADALDEALDRIAAGYESQRRFAANASHELRTPLALQRLLTEVAMEDPAAGEDLRRLGGMLLRANERNEKLIEGLLVLAESDRGLQGREPVRLDRLAASVLDAHRDLAGRKKVVVRRDLAERVVPGDPVLLERLVGNLVANAIAYNEPDGWVEVTVGTDPAIAVTNTGRYVPAETLPSLFEPFRRLTGDRIDHTGGTGLGLTIVRSIVTAHNGTVQARSRPEGGLIVQVTLPCRP